MKFEFAFETLLDHKHHLEDMARRDWLTAQNAVDAAMKELDELYSQVEQARQRAGQLQVAGGAHSAELSQIDDFTRGQKIRIEAKRAQVRILMGEAERFQELLLRASIERKTLEKLREKRLEEYKKMRKMRELKQVDELVTTRAQSQQFDFSQSGLAGKISSGVKAK